MDVLLGANRRAMRSSRKGLRGFIPCGALAGHVGRFCGWRSRAQARWRSLSPSWDGEGQEQERQLMRRFVLDHELLQQATSADYSEGEHSTQSDSYAA